MSVWIEVKLRDSQRVGEALLWCMANAGRQSRTWRQSPDSTAGNFTVRFRDPKVAAQFKLMFG
jgi:hypothetical protein